jgi:ribosomal-protein-alanine N-acetyltransferase
MTVSISLLSPEDEAELLAFETENRAFFARAVGDRGDAYFAEFPKRHRALVEENETETSMLFLVRDADGTLVGRVNLLDTDTGSPELGYRIAERAGGRGYAREAVRLALAAASGRGVRRVRAKTTVENLASRRVLEASGFEPADGEPAELKVNGEPRPAVHYVRAITSSSPSPSPTG